jgi:hypothetical protein
MSLSPTRSDPTSSSSNGAAKASISSAGSVEAVVGPMRDSSSRARWTASSSPCVASRASWSNNPGSTATMSVVSPASGDEKACTTRSLYSARNRAGTRGSR